MSTGKSKGPVTEKTCKKCGTIYVGNVHKRCPTCGAYHKEGVCLACGVYSTDLIVGMGSYGDWGKCRPCFNAALRLQVRRVDIKRRQEAEAKFAEWLETTNKIPFRAISENEWLEATRHFNGCAVCNSDEIVSRGFFIAAKDGGKYTPWNVVPLCEKCATALTIKRSPFIAMDPRVSDTLYAKGRRDGLKKLENIVVYLRGRMPSE